LQWRKVHRRIFAATIDFQFELKAITFVQIGHAGTFDSGDVHKRIGLAIVALNEAEALHRVEEFDRAGSLFARELTRRGATTRRACAFTGFAIARRTAIFDGHRLAIDLQIRRRNPAAAIDEREFQRLPFGKTGKAGLLDCGDVNENVLTAVVANDETETFLAVEEFDDALAFADHLGRHAAAGTAAAAASTAAAETAATATAAEAITAAAKAAATAAAEAITATTAAEAIAATTATETVTAAAEAAAAIATEAFVTEAVALVLAAALTAPPSIETHAVKVFPNVAPLRRKGICTGRSTQTFQRANQVAPNYCHKAKQDALRAVSRLAARQCGANSWQIEGDDAVFAKFFRPFIANQPESIFPSFRFADALSGLDPVEG
jgi:hypothetical protein